MEIQEKNSERTNFRDGENVGDRHLEFPADRITHRRHSGPSDDRRIVLDVAVQIANLANL